MCASNQAHAVGAPQLRLQREYEQACRQSDELFGAISPQALLARPIPERHRLIFYLGHLEAFDFNLLGRAVGEDAAADQAADAALHRLFAFGIDPPPGELPRDSASEWPSTEAARQYARRTRAAARRLWHAAGEEARAMALEHRLMHLETLAYLLHALPLSQRSLTPDSGPDPAAKSPSPEWIEIPAGPARLGRDAAEGFGWDNERPARSVQVEAFAIAKFQVSNGDFLDFVAAGGPPPPFWRPAGVAAPGRGAAVAWRLLAMAGDRPLPLAWPVFVTHDQAAAYARWRGLRLPTEAEWQRAAFASGGEAASGASRTGNFDFARWDPVPVTAHAEQATAFGARQMLGNGWEWTATPFAPWDGFAPHPQYPGYSQNFFDGEHFVLKGGSPRTAARLLRPSFRNWFRREYPHVFAGFRLAA